MSRQNPLRNVSWQQFEAMTPEQKAPLFCAADGTPYHVLIAQQFDRKMLDRVCDLATKTRRIAKTRGGMRFLNDLLCEKRAMLYFSQPSSRTFLSFYAACQIVGLKPAEVRDASTSSEIKGESQEDSVRTFSSYFDVIIMRHPQGGFAEKIAWLQSQTDRPVPVVNAGSGKDQHPTQAVLDIYTLQRSLEKRRGGIEGAKIAYVGDLARGRTVRSLAALLTHYPGVKQYFVAPKELQIGQDILNMLDRHKMPYEVTTNFEKVVPEVDAIYMTRIQDEWDQPGEKSFDNAAYCLEARHLQIMKADAIIMHPLPRRKEIAPEFDSDPRAKYWRQVRNGMWVRAVLMMMIFDREKEIDRYYEDMTADYERGK